MPSKDHDMVITRGNEAVRGSSLTRTRPYLQTSSPKTQDPENKQAIPPVRNADPTANREAVHISNKYQPCKIAVLLNTSDPPTTPSTKLGTKPSTKRRKRERTCETPYNVVVVRPEGGVPSRSREGAHVVETAGGACASLWEEGGVQTGLELSLGAHGRVSPPVDDLDGALVSVVALQEVQKKGNESGLK
jgi:hypothetical protein